jgi:hypothetical protein
MNNMIKNEVQKDTPTKMNQAQTEGSTNKETPETSCQCWNPKAQIQIRSGRNILNGLTDGIGFTRLQRSSYEMVPWDQCCHNCARWRVRFWRRMVGWVFRKELWNAYEIYANLSSVMEEMRQASDVKQTLFGRQPKVQFIVLFNFCIFQKLSKIEVPKL